MAIRDSFSKLFRQSLFATYQPSIPQIYQRSHLSPTDFRFGLKRDILQAKAKNLSALILHTIHGPFGCVSYENAADDLQRMSFLRNVALSVGVQVLRDSEGIESSAAPPILRKECNWQSLSPQDIKELLNGMEQGARPASRSIEPVFRLLYHPSLTLPTTPLPTRILVRGRVLGACPGGYAVSTGGWLAYLSQSDIPFHMTSDFLKRHGRHVTTTFRIKSLAITSKTGRPRISLAFHHPDPSMSFA